MGCLCQWELKAPTDRSRSDCVHEQVAKLGPVSRAAGMDCECPLYDEKGILMKGRISEIMKPVEESDNVKR